MTSPVKRPHAATRSRGEPVGKRYKWQVLVTVVFGTFMVILDGTAVNVALPTLQHVFNTSVDQVDGVIIAYTLASGVTIPVTGFVAERFGSKRTYLTALALFVVGSACCALAPSLAWLVGFRVLQGVGGGMLAPLGIALLFDATPPQERGLANGIFGLPLVLAPASGPLLGGYFTEYLNWRAIFLVNLPIGLLGIILGWFWLRSSHPSTPAKLDLPGLLLSMIGFTSLLYALQRGASIGWTSPLLLLLLSVGVVACVLLVFVEWQAPAPLLDLRLYLRRTYACASVVARTMLYQQQATHELHNPLTALGRQFLQHLQLLQQKGLPLGVAQMQAARQLLSTLAPVHLNQGFHDAYLTTFWLAVGSILLSFALPGRFPFSSYKQKKPSRAEPPL
jgi:MFS transporter, DHA2 family, multidrug resistance protein